jgi:hypothetical protein
MRPNLKSKTKAKRDGFVAQVVECLPTSLWVQTPISPKKRERDRDTKNPGKLKTRSLFYGYRNGRDEKELTDSQELREGEAMGLGD